ncbi:MAG TPA: hypothetical protein VHB47_21720 [Thermoanaerobaculia bacterium]|jgi:hypothetical protein|nr:hypothetical protein [Thermoanaerobaculia bacterium]
MVALLDCLLISLQLILAGAWAAPEPAAAAPAAAARELAELEDASLPPQRVLAAARELMKQVPASATGRGLPLDPAGRRRLLAGLGRAVLAAGGDGAGGAGAPALAGQLAEYLGAWAGERGRALGRRGGWTAAEVAELAAEDLVDPARFDDDAAFRRWVLELLPGELDPRTAPPLRDDLLLALERLPAIDFAAADAIESAWGAAPRRAADRLSAFGREPARFDDDADAPIAASVYSLPSSFFDSPVAAAFLAAVRAMAPGRDLLVLTDLPSRRRLAACCASPRLHLLETYGRGFSPWTRDPMSLTRRADGGVMVLVRPNAQPGREEDGYLGAQLVRQLPPALDRAWGGVRWEVAPVPFHNGQVLLTRDAAWISIHSLEPRILALLRLDRVPVESFATAAGIERYFAAARQAAAELATLYRRPVRFVHPLPPEVIGGGDDRQLAASRDLVLRMGGGAGYDLDSVLTLLPAAPGRPAVALVASLAAGRALLAALSTEDWKGLRRGYDLAPAGGELAAALGAAQQTPAAARLDGFLDLVATHLASQGFRVERLPLLTVPVTLLTDHEGVAGREFLLTWNNVVLETRGGRLRAEGFSSLLPAGDREARRVFTAAGCSLDLLPALVHSIVLNGGYRCASNHLRSSPGASQ